VNKRAKVASDICSSRPRREIFPVEQMSDGSLLPSPPAEKGTARQDQAVNQQRALAECPLQRKRIIRSFAKA
jgi:hypothetical protein